MPLIQRILFAPLATIGFLISFSSVNSQTIIPTKPEIVFIAKEGLPPKSLLRNESETESIKYGVSYTPRSITRSLTDKQDGFLLVAEWIQEHDVVRLPNNAPRKKLTGFSQKISLFNIYGEEYWSRSFEFDTDIEFDEYKSDLRIETFLPVKGGTLLMLIGGSGGEGLIPNKIVVINPDGVALCEKTWKELDFVSLNRSTISTSGKYIALMGWSSKGPIIWYWKTEGCQIKQLETSDHLNFISDKGLINLQNRKTNVHYLYDTKSKTH